VAAKSLEFFYNAKAFMLNDLILEKNQFSEVARETLLLLFNSYSQWATEVEYLMLNKAVLSEQEIGIILDRVESIESRHQNIFDIHTSVFVPEFMRVWYDTHKQTKEAFVQKVRKIEGISQLEAYPLVINALVGMLQGTLYELYEIDCLLGSNFVSNRCTLNRSNTNRLVAYVDDFALSYYRDTGVFLLQNRVKLYSGLACTDRLPMTIKNYSSEVVSMVDSVIQGDEPLASLLKQLQDLAIVLEIVSVPPTS
jgi:hypothetical protein